jgi:hypothetical protein
MKTGRIASLLGMLLLTAGAATAQTRLALGTPPGRSTMILGCWAAATTGDTAAFKFAFRDDGSMVQYDEKKPGQLRRSFGGWEMLQGSTFLTVYWPDGGVTRYNVKRIGPILHFAGMFGVRNFTLHEVDGRDCWRPVE